MHKIRVAIDTSDATLLKHCVRFLPILALRSYRVGIMTATAGNTVPTTQSGLSLLCELNPMSRPGLRIFEIVRELGINITYARGGFDIGLEEPVCSRDMAVATTRQNTLAVTSMRRLLEVRIVSLNVHRVTGRAECIGPCGMINHRARDDGSRADCRSAKQQNNEHPPFELHC